LWWEQLAGEPQDAAVEYVLSHPYREITVRQQLSSGIAPEGSRIETRMERLITPLDIPGAYRARVRLLRRSESGGGWRAAGEIELAGALSFPPAFQRSSPPPLPASAPLVAPLGPGVRGTLGPRSATVVSWPDPTPAARLLVLSSLGYALDVPDATAVAEIMVNPGSPDEFAAIIRTGSDTAEWSLTAPANLAQSAHRLAPVAWSWDDGAGQAGAVYWCQVELPAPRAIARIRLRNLTDRATVTFQYIGTCVQP